MYVSDDKIVSMHTQLGRKECPETKNIHKNKIGIEVATSKRHLIIYWNETRRVQSSFSYSSFLIL